MRIGKKYSLALLSLFASSKDSSAASTACCCPTCSGFGSSGGSSSFSALNLPDDPADGHLLDLRWDFSANTSGPLAQGDPMTLTWGFVGDGTNIEGVTVNGNVFNDAPSSLIATLDSTFGSGGGGSDYTNRPWFSFFSSSYNRWGELSGLTFQYEANDDGNTINGSISAATRGSAGVRPDMRIGGRSLAGTTVLGYNYFPDAGDMVLGSDKFGSTLGNAANGHRALRNTIMHEAGHGLGMRHPESISENFLMEPFLSSAFDGPQHADILALHRGYGDANEAGTGNDTLVTATNLGNVESFTGIGFDGDNADVLATDTDFVSIDGISDVDYFAITLAEAGILDVTLESLGLAYDIQRQGDPGSRVNVNTAALNDLTLEFYNALGVLLASANASGAGGMESIIGQSLTAGNYFIRVSGSDDVAQFYSLTTLFSPFGTSGVIPEPSQIVLISASLGGLLLRRRRR